MVHICDVVSVYYCYLLDSGGVTVSQLVHLSEGYISSINDCAIVVTYKSVYTMQYKNYHLDECKMNAWNEMSSSWKSAKQTSILSHITHHRDSISSLHYYLNSYRPFQVEFAPCFCHILHPKWCCMEFMNNLSESFDQVPTRGQF